MSMSIDWSSIQVESWNPSSNYEAKDVFMTIERDPSDRNVGGTYAVERGFLDMIDQKDFIHRTYEVMVHLMHEPIYVEFNPTAVRIGLSAGYRK